MTAPNTTSKCHTCENLHAKTVDLLTVDYCEEGYYTPPKDCPCYIEKLQRLPLMSR